jgi:hypothetical protein
MPAYATDQPYAPRFLDLIDATDRSYRQIESAYAGSLLIRSALGQLQNRDSKTGLVQPTLYFMPSSISTENRVVYEAIVAAFLGQAPAIDGTATGAVFTATVSPVWPVDGLVGKSLVVVGTAAGKVGSVLATIVSNTADTVTVDHDLFEVDAAAVDSITLVGLAGSNVELLNALMSLT